MCLDFPEKVIKVGIFDILPNRHIWTVQKKNWSMTKWHWLLMMQPYDLPENYCPQFQPSIIWKKSYLKEVLLWNFAEKLLMSM